MREDRNVRLVLMLDFDTEDVAKWKAKWSVEPLPEVNEESAKYADIVPTNRDEAAADLILDFVNKALTNDKAPVYTGVLEVILT